MELYLDVLKVIDSGTKKPTHIRYKCNLSGGPLQEILEKLEKQRLITVHVEGSHRIYEVTETGKAVARYYEKAAKELELPPTSFLG